MQQKLAGTIHVLLSFPVRPENVPETLNAHIEKFPTVTDMTLSLYDFSDLLLRCQVRVY